MMKIKLYVALLLLCAVSLHAQKFVLEGEIANAYEGKMYLLYGDKVDSVSVENQKFRFEGKIAFPVKANLSTSKYNRATGFLILESGNLSADVIIENKSSVHFKGLSGSKSVEELKNFMIYKSKNRKAPNLKDLLFVRLNDIIKKNPKNQLYGLLLAETLSEKNLSYQHGVHLLKVLDTKTQDPKDVQRIKTILGSLEQTQLGAVFPTMELPDEKDVMQRLVPNTKPFTLVVFSSSECIGCIELDRRLKEVYSQYKNKGFAVYEAFLEGDKASWQEHIAREKLPWTTTLAIKKYNNEQIKAVGVTSLPSNFLLDGNGKIIAINIPPLALAQRLSILD